MPNLKGGKKYKSSKHADTGAEFHEISEGQSLARVLKHLGDRNVLIYCDDCRERIGHIRGGLTKKKGFIEVGDIVLISLRNEELENSKAKKEKADILAKYDRSHHKILKQIENVNPHLFTQLEAIDHEAFAKHAVDDGFEFESQDEGSQSGDEEGAAQLTEEQKKQRKLKKEEKAKERDQSVRNARSLKGAGKVEQDNDDFDIDDI